MRFKQKVYDRNNALIKSSSDLSVFKYPQYEVVGMDVITPGLTSNSPNVYIVDSDIDINVDITFINNLDQLTEDTQFNYYILPYNKLSEQFKDSGAYTSTVFTYAGVNHTNTVNTSKLTGEGEYLFKLGYQYDILTEIANKLGKRQVSNTFNKTLPYGNYDEKNDKYFVMLYKAQEPLLDIGITDDGVNEGSSELTKDKLTITSLNVEHGVSEYALNVSTTSDLFITWNGSVFTKGQDYSITGNLLKFFEPLHSDDLVNLIYFGKSNTSGLRSKSIVVPSPIPSGITGEQGENDVFFNSETQKFEIYTDYKISNPDSFIVMIGGQTLANKIDYFVSSTNPKRVILSGELRTDDLVTILYDSGENLVRSVTEGHLDITWYTNKNITTTNGEFTIEFSKDKTFMVLEQSEVVPYILNQTNYTKRVTLNYDYGQVLYYRIKNTKNYQTISEDNLSTENFSDVIRIEIKTNISNNY